MGFVESLSDHRLMFCFFCLVLEYRTFGRFLAREFMVLCCVSIFINRIRYILLCWPTTVFILRC